MAKKKEKKAEVKLERVYNVPLRREWLKSPLHRRSKKAVSALKQFLSKHMKADIKDIKIGPYLNEKIWERGIRFPPHHVKVNAKKDSEGKVNAELVGAPVPKEEKKKEKKKEAGIEKKVEKEKEEVKKEVKEKIEEKMEKEKPKKEEKKEPVKEQQEKQPSETKVEEENKQPKESKEELKEKAATEKEPSETKIE